MLTSLQPNRVTAEWLWFQDLIEYKNKHRILKVRTLDGALKTLQVDDSHTVGQLMIPICSRMGRYRCVV